MKRGLLDKDETWLNPRDEDLHGRKYMYRTIIWSRLTHFIEHLDRTDDVDSPATTHFRQCEQDDTRGGDAVYCADAYLQYGIVSRNNGVYRGRHEILTGRN